MLERMTEVFEKTGRSIVAVEKVPREEISKYGVIGFDPVEADPESDVFEVADLIEKPSEKEAPSDLAVIGRYILDPIIFDILLKTKPGRNGEIQLTDALRSLAKQGKLMAYRFTGRRFDCGTVDGFVEATQYYYEFTKGIRK